MARQLVVNADDFGFTSDVNSGIVEAHQHGILTAATLMADGAAFEDAVKLGRENPELDIGVHLVLVDLPGLPRTPFECATAVYSGQIDIYSTFAAQVRKIMAAGIRPTHLDTHKHTHVLPPVLRAVCTIAEEFQIPWVRTPADFRFAYGVKSLPSKILQSRLPGLRRTIDEAGLRHTDSFTGFAWTGRFTERDLTRLFPALPDGVTELMCHPGHCGEELKRASTRLKESRVQELRALCHPATRAALESNQIKLVRYRDL